MSTAMATTQFRSEQQIAAWMTAYLAEKLKVDPSRVDPRRTFVELGIDSLAAVVMTGDLSEWVGFDVEPSQLFEFPTVEQLSARVCQASRDGNLVGSV
jgi:acyl carrier protein